MMRLQQPDLSPRLLVRWSKWQESAENRAAFDALEERERRLMEMLYRQGVSQQDAGVELGVSASMVCRMHEAIVVKLRRRLRDW